MYIIDHFRSIISESKEPVIIECGTCEGDHTHFMCSVLHEMGKNFTFHAFEPNINLKQDFINRNEYDLKTGNLKIFFKAIGKENGKCNFWVSSGKNKITNESYHGSSSIKKPQIILREYPDMSFTETTVDVVSLDAHCKEHNLDSKVIDFIWADVQSAEKDLILGGLNTLRNTRYFYTEYIDGYSYEEKASLSDILKLLPYYEIVEDYGGDVLLKNTLL